MELFEIVSLLNEKTDTSRILHDFQKKRRETKNKTRGTNQFFGTKIHDDYAFHYGGRHEIQFNVGNDEDTFRFGLAFSLEPGIDLTDPLFELRPKVDKYNQYFRRNPRLFLNSVMWCWNSEGKSPVTAASLIPDEWIANNSFIFIGAFFPKNSNKITPKDIDVIIKKFEELYPIYEFIELQENKLAKICWNTNFWEKPSGLEGKSLDKNSYERKYGFGHEEWLFDTSRQIDGYHYSALQAIGKHRQKYADRKFDIRLYTYSSKTKKWYWVARIENVTAIGQEEAKKVFDTYKQNQWIDELKDDLKSVTVNSAEIDALSDLIFNIKFKMKDVYLFDDEGLLEFNEGERIRHTRYTLLNDVNSSNVIDENVPIQIVSSPSSDGNIRKVLRIRKSQTNGPIEFDLSHGNIQDKFYQFLQKNCPQDDITKEAVITGINKRIDLFQKTIDSRRVIYEVKSYVTLEASLRIALGQMLEYAYFPNRSAHCQLVLVSDREISQRVKDYVTNLNALLKVDVGIVNFDAETESILDSVNFQI